ncbi:MAG: methyltransferase domain-containing protein [candidate division WOR-3 bacterium]
MVKVLEIGSGLQPYRGKEGEEVIHLDKIPFPEVEVVWDLEITPYPFPDDTFDKVIANHCIEHLSDTIKVLAELWRISKNKAEIFIRVPYYSSYLAFQDPTHKRFFTEETFRYFTKERPISFSSPVNFSLKSVNYFYQYPRFARFLKKFFPLLYRFLKNHLLNFIKEIEVELVVEK